jgi:antitoxin (DNA-binding transcriptional repressor) of toxin-antitoxin stability system
MDTKELGVRELRANLAGVLREVQDGAIVRITSHGEVIAELRPPETVVKPRAAGALRGRITLAPDFDELPEDVLAAMESRI